MSVMLRVAGCTGVNVLECGVRGAQRQTLMLFLLILCRVMTIPAATVRYEYQSLHIHYGLEGLGGSDTLMKIIK